MSLYGNVTNKIKQQFTFDRIYRSRVSMDDAAENDKVVVGRYVLVQYDDNNSLAGDDYNKYKGHTYNGTVWMKTYNASLNQFVYVKVANNSDNSELVCINNNTVALQWNAESK